MEKLIVDLIPSLAYDKPLLVLTCVLFSLFFGSMFFAMIRNCFRV